MRLPLLHVISPQGIGHDTRFTEVADALQAACGPELAIHLRDPGASGDRLYRLACHLVNGARRHGGWCAVNERTDVAMAAGAQAVQLGHRALPLEAVRRTVGARLPLGVSAHSEPEVREAAKAGANYVVLGTIFRSPSHASAHPLGTAALSNCRDSGVPVVAIGGINSERAAPVLAAGASAVAVLSAVWEAGDPVAAAVDLLDRLAAERRDR
jgi:thiamine-phosphate diphosphorylase